MAEGFNELTTAIANDNIELVKKISKKNKKKINNLYTIEGKTYTPLTLAITYGYTDIIEELLKNKYIDVNQVDGSNYTPLTTAIKYNKINIVKKLLEISGVDVNQVDGNKNTPLITAITYGYTDIIEELLKNKYIDINKIDGSNYTPLTTAIVSSNNDNIEVINKLLESKDIDINKADNYNFTPIIFAVLKDKTKIVEKLFERSDLDITKPEINEKYLYEAILSRNNPDILELFINYIKSNLNKNINYSLLLDMALEKNNNEIANFLIENHLEQIKKESIPKILENIRNKKNPNMELFNSLLLKINESERKKYLEPIKNINQNKQGKEQITISKEFVLNKKTGLIEIRDVAYAKIKDKDDNSKTIISNNKLYEIIYNEDGSKTIIHYKADNEEILFTEKIKENKIIEIKFNENDFEKINRENKDENERKNKIINYFRDEIIKIHNIDYKSLDAFDDTLSRINYAQTYLGEYLENKAQNIIFDLNLTEIDTDNIKEIEDISGKFKKINDDKIEYIADKIIESSNSKNKDKIFIFDLGYIINPDKISIENIGHFGSHTIQIVISNGKANMINTGGSEKFDDKFIKQINEKIKEKTIKDSDSIKNINNMFQLKKVGVCNVASKIYLNILFTEYKKKFGNLFKITERIYNFQKAIKYINKTEKKEIKERFKEKKEEEIDEIIKLNDIIKNTNNIVGNDYGKYFSEENKNFTNFSGKLTAIINELEEEKNKQKTPMPN